MNQLRYQLWQTKNAAVKSRHLPLCQDSLYQHSLTGSYQNMETEFVLKYASNIAAKHSYILRKAGTFEIQFINCTPAL